MNFIQKEKKGSDIFLRSGNYNDINAVSKSSQIKNFSRGVL